MKNKTTIKELSKICGVSEQSIRKWCRKHDISKDNNNKYLLSDDIKFEILRNYGCETTKTLENTKKIEKCETESSKLCETSKPNCETDYAAEMIDFLKEQIKEKDKQIESLNKQFELLNNRLLEDARLLDQEQKLRLVAEKQLEEKQIIEEKKESKKSWWKFWD